MNSTCNFFQWADENTDNWDNSSVNSGRSREHRGGSNAPKRPRLTGSKRKCGICGVEGTYNIF